MAGALIVQSLSTCSGDFHVTGQLLNLMHLALCEKLQVWRHSAQQPECRCQLRFLDLVKPYVIVNIHLYLSFSIISKDLRKVYKLSSLVAINGDYALSSHPIQIQKGIWLKPLKLELPAKDKIFIYLPGSELRYIAILS